MSSSTPNRTFQLPDFTLVPASAGSGKTTELTKRYLRLLMTPGIPHNNLRQILAITFTKNAAKEMKERILEVLMGAALGDRESLDALQGILPADDETLKAVAAMNVELILEDYSDFQVQTIDSFITRVLKASALDLGLTPEFEVKFDAGPVLDEALDLFARELAGNPSQQQLFGQLTDLVSEQQRGDATFLWNPFRKISAELHMLYRQLSAQTGEPKVPEYSKRLQEIRQEILKPLVSIGELEHRPGIIISKLFAAIIAHARAGEFDSVIDKKLGQKILNKPQGVVDETAVKKIHTLQEKVLLLQGEFLELRSRSYYAPYLQAYRMIRHHLDEVKRRRGTVILGEANRALANMLTKEIVPEIYYSLGEQVHHYLIDEFQDTSPLQWAALRPLIEHSLGGEGSLFLVGDMKQSIYTFRGGDWRIMRRMMEREEFPSVPTAFTPLTTNYRSAQRLVEFTKELFQTRVPAVIPPDVSDLSGLASYEQEVDEKKKGKGYVEVHVVDSSANDEEERSGQSPEQEKLLAILRTCRERGYQYRDIAILSPRNKDVIEVSRWLNAAAVPFLSHSSLDIRTRKLTGELLTLLRFLDSPVDDLAFATFLLGQIFSNAVRQAEQADDWHSFIHRVQHEGRRTAPLYSRFRSEYPELWDRYFEQLFNLVGYLPVYDLVAEVYKAFDLFVKQSQEEATLVKFLEVINNFEKDGNNSLKDFLALAVEEDEVSSDTWNIETAKSENAVEIMTVHKAKGLGFTLLIVLFYDSPTKIHNPLLVGSGEEMQLLRVTSDWANKSEALNEYYVEALTFAQVDDLNKLYVALTRAREELHLICVKKKKDGKPSLFFPQNGSVIGTPLRKVADEPTMVRLAPILAVHTRGLAQSRNFDALNLRETRRGEFIHNVLSDIEYVDAQLEEKIAASLKKWKQRGIDRLNLKEIQETLSEFFKMPEVRSYFTPKDGRLVLNEQEIVDRSGALHRVDRLVIDSDGVTILDYKTGEEQESYREQVHEYMDIVQGMYPGNPVRGFLLFVDRRTIREVQ